MFFYPGYKRGVVLRNIFYVYEHWRPDKDVCFYVGKGKGNRALCLKRDHNKHHQRVVAKLARQGMCVEVRLVAFGRTSKEACELEIARIAFWRNIGVRLVNQTAGGDGMLLPSAETRSRLSKAQKGRKHTAEAKEKVRQARLGMKFSHEHKAALSAAKLGRKRPPFTDETRARMRAASLEREALRRATRLARGVSG